MNFYLYFLQCAPCFDDKLQEHCRTAGANSAFRKDANFNMRVFFKTHSVHWDADVCLLCSGKNHNHKLGAAPTATGGIALNDVKQIRRGIHLLSTNRPHKKIKSSQEARFVLKPRAETAWNRGAYIQKRVLRPWAAPSQRSLMWNSTGWHTGGFLKPAQKKNLLTLNICAL